MKVLEWDRSPLVTPNAKIAHQVEHQFEALGVVGSSPTLGTKICERGGMVYTADLKSAA